MPFPWLQMLESPQQVVKSFSLVVRLMIVQFKNMKRKLRTKVGRAGEYVLVVSFSIVSIRTCRGQLYFYFLHE